MQAKKMLVNLFNQIIQIKKEQHIQISLDIPAIKTKGI